MKKHLIAFLLLAVPLLFPASAQELKIKSFELNMQSAMAKTNPRRDNNGEECALVRVYVALQGATFAEYLIGDVVSPRPSEYWVYMPAGTRWIQVNHPDYLPFRYEFSERLQAGRTYDLYLLLPEKAAGPVAPEMNSQFLALTVTPTDAMVLVDDMPRSCVGGGLSLELAFGTHTYLVSAPMYHTQKGEFVISPSGTTQLQVDLKAAFGYVSISSAPESGAQVLVGGEVKGTTPCRLKLESGTYQVQVVKSGYIAYAQTVAVNDGQTTSVAASLKANFSQVSLVAPNREAEIWVSGKKYGVGIWSGRLDAGTYSVESRCEGYEPAKDVVTVEPATPRTYTLTEQVPIYGLLKATSTPMGATVKLDGKAIGKTPFMSNQILTGTHSLEIAAEGYLPHKETFTLARNGRKECAVTLNKKPLKRYQVGDLFDEEGKKGVVFQVDGTGYNGKIVALTDAPSEMTWADAKKYCSGLGHGWYLPEIEDLSKCYQNPGIVKYGGKALAGIYWSSTVSTTSGYARIFNIAIEISRNASCESSYKVRPIAGFGTVTGPDSSNPTSSWVNTAITEPSASASAPAPASVSSTALTIDNLFPISNITLGKTTIEEVKKMGHKVDEKSYSPHSVCSVDGIAFWDFDEDRIFERIHMTYFRPIPDRWQKLGFKWEQSIETWQNLFEKSGYTVTQETKYYSSLGKSIEITAVSKDSALKFELKFAYGHSPYSIDVDVTPAKSSRTATSTASRSSTTTVASTSVSTSSPTSTASSGYYVGQDIGVGYVFYVDKTGKHGLVVTKDYKQSLPGKVYNLGGFGGSAGYKWSLPSLNELYYIYDALKDHYVGGTYLAGANRGMNFKAVVFNKKHCYTTSVNDNYTYRILKVAEF